jgi:uncharacterized protein (DUF58 family)
MAGAATALRLGIALAAAGILFAAPVVLLPGVALVLLVGGCAAWVRLSVLGLTARRTGVPAEAVEGERFEVVVDGISGWLPLVARIEDDAIARPAPLRILRPRSAFTVRLEGVAGRRGRRRLAAPVLSVADPLGTASARVVAGAAESILVLPRIEPLTGSAGAGGPAVGRRDGGLGELAALGERESPADTEIDGVRPYRPGTKATRIYWPALARGAGLAERRLAAAGESAPLVALDPSGATCEEDLDRAVRAAASLVAHLARLGGCELVIGGSRHRLGDGGGPRSWMGPLAALAVVRGDEGPPRLRGGDARACVIWVSASHSPRAPSLMTGGFLVAPGRLPGVPEALRVAGCAGYDLTRARAPRMAA